MRLVGTFELATTPDQTAVTLVSSVSTPEPGPER